MEHGYKIILERIEDNRWVAEIEWLHKLYDGRLSRTLFVRAHDTIEQLMHHIIDIFGEEELD